MDVELLRRALAEFVGTLLLVLLGTGSVVAAVQMGGGELPYAALGFIAFAFWVGVTLPIYMVGAVSGAHLNPAVTLALAATGRFAWRDVAAYVGAQLLGAVGASVLLVGLFGKVAADLGLGATAPGPDVSSAQLVLVEVVGTFVLMMAIMAVAVDPRAPVGLAGLLIGLTVAGAILSMGPLTGGSMNPARTFGPLVGLTVFDGDPDWGSFWAYVLAPVAGAVLAVVTYDFLARPRAAEEPAPTPETAS